jgi:ubiquinone/menaquinone biosynthesis C-methylase UbiE
MPDPTGRPIDSLQEFPPDSAPPGCTGKIRTLAASAFTTLLRFAFHLLYHQLAFTYDAVAWIVSAGEWADWRRCVIPYLPPGRVLEIAHGTGTLSQDMAERGHSVTGIDLSPEMGKIALGKIRRRRKNSAKIGSIAGPALVRADAQRLPFQAGSFAAATATFPADFLFQPPTFRAVHRALCPGGVWIILPTAFPEGFARRWLPDEKTLSSGGLWVALFRQMEDCGFRVRMEILRRPRSRVLIILAEKQ